jgi:hypothetical protein
LCCPREAGLSPDDRSRPAFLLPPALGPPLTRGEAKGDRSVGAALGDQTGVLEVGGETRDELFGKLNWYAPGSQSGAYGDRAESEQPSGELLDPADRRVSHTIAAAPEIIPDMIRTPGPSLSWERST